MHGLYSLSPHCWDHGNSEPQPGVAGCLDQAVRSDIPAPRGLARSRQGLPSTGSRGMGRFHARTAWHLPRTGAEGTEVPILEQAGWVMDREAGPDIRKGGPALGKTASPRFAQCAKLLK